jgi:hypothetical protein
MHRYHRSILYSNALFDTFSSYQYNNGLLIVIQVCQKKPPDPKGNFEAIPKGRISVWCWTGKKFLNMPTGQNVTASSTR